MSRRLVLLVVAATLGGCSLFQKPQVVAQAVVPDSLPPDPPKMAPICARPPEKTAFDVTGLKSQLMLIALSCKGRDKYNTVITQHRSELQATDKNLSSFFKRGYTGRGTAAHDDYITTLANAQSMEGLRSGTAFCDRSRAMLDQAASLPKSGKLADYAAGQRLVQPLLVTQCAATAAK